MNLSSDNACKPDLQKHHDDIGLPLHIGPVQCIECQSPRSAPSKLLARTAQGTSVIRQARCGRLLVPQTTRNGLDACSFENANARCRSLGPPASDGGSSPPHRIRISLEKIRSISPTPTWKAGRRFESGLDSQIQHMYGCLFRMDS